MLIKTEAMDFRGGAVPNDDKDQHVSFAKPQSGSKLCTRKCQVILRLGHGVHCPLNSEIAQDKYDLGVKMQPMNMGK